MANNISEINSSPLKQIFCSTILNDRYSNFAVPRNIADENHRYLYILLRQKLYIYITPMIILSSYGPQMTTNVFYTEIEVPTSDYFYYGIASMYECINGGYKQYLNEAPNSKMSIKYDYSFVEAYLPPSNARKTVFLGLIE